MKRVVIYARVSSKRQEEEGFSIPAQIEFLTEYARQNNFIIEAQFVEAETAKRAGRKEFNNMLKYIEANHIDAILAEKTDRVYRNLKDYLTLDEFKQLEVHLVKENMIISEKSSSHIKFMHGIKVLMAKQYIDNLSEEVKKGKDRKAKEGYYPQQAPVGYMNIEGADKKRIIVPDPDKAPYVCKLFTMYNHGTYSIQELRKILYKEGFNHNGKPYSKARLLAILHDPFYIGKFIYKGVTYLGKHEPLVPDEIFYSVQRSFNQSKARKHDTEFLYTGLIHCGHCGCQMTAELKKGKYVYYHCTGKRGGDCKKDWIREEQLDEVFMDLISKIPNPDSELFDLIRAGIKEARKLKGEYEEHSVEEIEKQIKRLQARIDNLYTDKLDGKITEEFWKEKHNKWYEEKEELIQRLGSINNAARTFDEGTNLLENFCKHAPQEYLTACPKTKREILKIIGSNFTYKDKKVSVVLTSVFDLLLNYPFSKNGGIHKPKLEPQQFIYKLKIALSQEFIDRLKALDMAA